MKYLYRLNKPLVMFRKIFPLFLTLVLCLTQISAFLTSSQAFCVPSTKSSLPSVSLLPIHRCCCEETGSCCCDVRQESTATWPDMGLPAISGGGYDPPPRCVNLDTGLPILLLSQYFQSPGRWTGTGPPLTSSYLVNLTFRC
jgi:hypothetical protein